ncbi:MucBP domain-containing protein [Lactobacillus isalae]|uniref:MucBP domain-containing protein n=1 Tax=Lactobacillus isalae TaxID=2993455 RepID=UPI0024A8097F|nr:MucBP domain-containing protein [Lactobacillus isalae]
MLSKRNQDLNKNLADEKQRFSIRKFNVGAASVLLGTSLMLGVSTQVAHADSNVNDNSIATINASNADNQDKQVTTSNHTAQDNVNFEANKTSESNVDDTQTSKDSTEDKIASTQESNQVQKDQSNNVTATTNKSAQDSKETTTLNLQSAQPVVASALKESKVAEPTKQVTATLNIYDYDDTDLKTPDVNRGEGVAFTYTGKFTDGLSIRDAIQAQIDQDTQKQLAYKDQGTAIVPDKAGLPTEIGVSPVVYSSFSDNTLGGYHFRYETTPEYTKDLQTQLVDQYNKWLDYKKAHFALAGYKLADQDEQAINLDDPIEAGKTYNIYVNHQISVVNIYHWTELKRTVEFKYYYKQDDKNDQAADSVTKNGYYNDGKYNQAQPKQFINHTGEPVFSNLPKIDNNRVNQTDISDANSFETRLLPDDLKTTKDQTKVLHDTINSRYVDLALGLITDNQGNLNNYGKATPIYPSGTILFEGEPVKQIDGWHTFDPDVPDTGSDDITDTNTYSTVQGAFNKGIGGVNVAPVNNPATTTIYYYHDQPVDITFEDVTNGDANASILSNFTASKDLQVDLNSEYIPGKPHTTPKDKKNNKNQKYEAYSYQADDNTYDASAINVDPSGTLKSSKSLNYADVLKAYTDNGYVLVSSDPDDLTYELEDVYDNNRNLQHKKRVVKLVHRAVAHTDTKTANRTIHYVANSEDGKQLQDDTTQNVTLTSSTYYTDAVTGNRVNAKQDANGDWIVDTANTDPVPAITWTVNADKSTGLTTDNKNFAAITTPETITLDAAEAAKRGTDGGEWYLVSTDKNGEVSYGDPTSDTWKSDTPNKIADGYLVYKQKAQYNIHYIDVNGVEGKTTYAPTDGHELTDRLVQNVGEGKGIFVGDTPDATSKLWSPADYEKAGYVLVGLSDNAKGDLLGKQTLTHGVQDQYVYLKHAVKTITPNTPVDEVPKDPEGNPIVDPSDLHKEFHRTIFYKANTTDGQTLMGQTDQKTEFNGTIAYDVVTGKTTTPETVKDVNGKDVQVATLKDGTISWDKLNDKFSAINQPTIELKKGDKYATSDDMIGTWYLVDGEAGEVDLTPASKNPDDKTLVYKQKAQYNIHYIDVNGVEDKTTYAPTDGHELTDYLVQNVGEDKGSFVGDTPDATSKLWSPADYEKAGYVLVGLSDNAKGDLLGKQTLTHGVQDQYVYLKHAVKDITPNTPVDEVPKDPDGKRAVDPSDLHKEFTRTITFVANNDAKSPLKDAVPQKVEFDGHIYVDMVTGQTTTPETVKDANGKTTQVATTKAGNIEWNHDTQTMDEVVQKYITLNKGDKYATSDDMVGTWHWISGTADEITLTPTSDNPEDLQLVYEKNEHETGPDEDHDLPKVDVKQETKTFTRTIVYRGTKDGGKTYQDVNGSPDGKNTYKQTVTFTRNIFSTTNKDGKVTILETDPWTAPDSTMARVDSKKPSEVGYDKVDIESVPAITVDPNSDKTDLGTTVVTYTISSVTPPVEETHHVTVHYVDEDGNVIKDPVKDPTDYKNGESYDENSRKDSTIEHDGKTYEFTRVKEGDNPTGTIQGKDVDVTYVYKLKETPVTPPTEETHHVTVHYVDENGNVIKDPVKDPVDYKNGESYDENSRKDTTIEYDGKTYEFTRVKEGDVPAGTIDGKDVDVTYVYKLKETPVTPPTEETYHVTVHYVDEDGNVIKDPVKDPVDYKNGESYDENSRKDTTIEYDGKTYEFTRVKEGDVPAGTIDGKDVDVTYVYKLKETPVTPPVEETHHVTVHYVDEDGNVIKDPVKDPVDYKNGESYDENSKKDTTIEHDGKTYEFTRVKEGDVPAGTIDGKDVDVTYVYKLKETPVTPPVEETHHVTVHYVDEDGNVIKDPVKDPVDYKNGESYDENSKKDTTIEHDGKTYEFTRVKEGDVPAGTIDGKDVDVTYVYKLKETPVTPPTEETYHVTVHYVDEDGNVIKDPVKDPVDYKNGESYDENSKKDTTIEHDGKTYEFTRVKEGDVPAGTIDGKDVDVTYVYKLKETPVTPPVEETYNVTVHYVDEDGNVIKDPVKDPVDYKNGESYDENSKKDTTIEHDGKTYEFTRVKEGDVPAGTIDGKDVDVTYVYKLKETPVTPPVEETYNVTVHYVDEDGNVIKDPVKDPVDYKNGESYDENSKKDTTIEHDGKTYEFTRVKEGDVPAGTIDGKDVDVTYVYKLKETPVTPPTEETYHVTVHYVDEDGNVIKDPVKDPVDYKNGESYDENSKKDTTIEYDGKTYEFTRVEKGESPVGTVDGKDVDVTYVYKEVVKPSEEPASSEDSKHQAVKVSSADNKNKMEERTTKTTKKSVETPVLSQTASVAHTPSATYKTPKSNKQVVSQQATKTLPQTGEKKNSNLTTVVGLAALALSGIITLAIDRKKKN